MGRVAVELANGAQEVLLTRDPDKAVNVALLGRFYRIRAASLPG